jgi:hypothetical protein
METETGAAEKAKSTSELPETSPESHAQAEQLKEEGNKLFAANKFIAARDAYTKVSLPQTTLHTYNPSLYRITVSNSCPPRAWMFLCLCQCALNERTVCCNTLV